MCREQIGEGMLGLNRQVAGFFPEIVKKVKIASISAEGPKPDLQIEDLILRANSEYGWNSAARILFATDSGMLEWLPPERKLIRGTQNEIAA